MTEEIVLLRTGLWNFVSSTLMVGIFLAFPSATVLGQQPNASRTPTAPMRPLTVSPEHPSIWTLEQAHYLLAQMHRRNLDLKTSRLENLDPNAVDGMRIDAIRSIIQASAEFDDVVGINNRSALGERSFRSTRRETLIRQVDELETLSSGLVQQIAELRMRLVSATDDTERENIEKAIVELQTAQQALDARISQKSGELNSLGEGTTLVSPGTGSVATAPANEAYKTALSEALTALTKQFAGTPQLNASLRLDNYLQMQYEILSKQLTLLRDELGPGERLIFLEMPQSINTAYDKADNKWAQTWWKVIGYGDCVLPAADTTADHKTKCEDLKDYPHFFRSRFSSKDVVDSMLTPTTAKQFLDALEIKTSDFVLPDESHLKDFSLQSFLPQNSVLESELYQHLSKALVSEIDVYNKSVVATPRSDAAVRDSRRKQMLIKSKITEELNRFINGEVLGEVNFKTDAPWGVQKLAERLPASSKLFRRLVLREVYGFIKDPIPGIPPLSFTPLISKPFDPHPISPEAKVEEPARLEGASNLIIDDRSVRVVDLFPKQGSLNVNDLRLSNKRLSFSAIFKLLSGIGGSGSYEREREQYSQFVQQELYSSGFGKGSNEFGWTFSPMPGSKRILPGTKTTFAIMVVPQNAAALVMEGRGAYFSRSARQPEHISDTDWLQGKKPTSRDWSASRRFIVPIPDGGVLRSNSIRVKGLHYSNVDKGKRIVLTIDGENFTNQTGILVNGTPLLPTINLGQPQIVDDSSSTLLARASLGRDNNGVEGVFERIGNNRLVATFKVDPSFEGVPDLKLVAPGMLVDVGTIKPLIVNGRLLSLTEKPPSFFGKRDPLKITGLTIFKSKVVGDSKFVRVVISGTGFCSIGGFDILVNGDPKLEVAERKNCGVVRSNLINDSTISLEFVSDGSETLSVHLAPHERAPTRNGTPGEKYPNSSITAKNPFVEKKDPKDHVNPEAIYIGSQKKQTGETAVFRIGGKGFERLGIKALPGLVKVVSDTEALLEISLADVPNVIKFSLGGQETAVVVTIPDKAPPKPTEK